MELNPAAINMNPAIIRSVEAMFTTLYERSAMPQIAGLVAAADRRTLSIPTGLTVTVGRMVLFFPPCSLDLNLAGNWDSVATDYTVAANRAGKDFFLYATLSGRLILSANSTAPIGYSSGTYRLIGGFHCECLSVGTISGHPLSGFLTGDTLPNSLWDLIFRSPGLQQGMVYSPYTNLWGMIYLQSGTGPSTSSVFGGTITDTRNWMDCGDDLAAVGLRMYSDAEFQIDSEGSNQMTNISGSADPVTTGGHVDTAGRRMISGIGCEDCCGAMYQWLSDQSYQNDSSTYNGAFGWYTLPGSKGSIYRQGASGDVKLLAGGHWNSGSLCGSRSRYANFYRWTTYSSLGSRGCARRQG